ncbi:MAG: bifunctional nuclease family protein [Bacteroidales bacterium]|nr:bifunctional nuclease family protein [Bacteroidales bacterium]
MESKVKLRVMGLTFSQTQTGSYALVLAEESGKKRIPIMIGAFEAQAIALFLEELKPPRPLTHDLFLSFSRAYGVELQEVMINKLEEGIFYSELVFVHDDEITRIDSRTSDAVALALRFKCPIYTSESIIEKAGIILEDKADDEKDIEDKLDEDADSIELKSLSELEELLAQAIANEDYETASQIRDEMKRRQEDKNSFPDQK